MSRMGYSQIKSIEVENFMVYSHAIINFDDTNIINLKGYNSSGKSSLLKAIAVCLMNMYPKSQSKFIRHGEQYFRIAISFDDGVVLRKDKYINGKTLYEVYKDGKCVLSTKEGNSLTKVAEIPQTIQDYLGLCFVSLGCLNYQVRQDPLWLIETTGSKNYASLNEILKSDELAKANAMLNSDVNKLNSDITSIEASLQETRLSLVEARGYSEDLLANLERRELLCKELTTRYRLLKSIYVLSGEILDTPYIPDVTSISDEQLDRVMKISNHANSIDTVEYPDIQKLDIGMYKDITVLSDVADSVGNVGKPLPSIEVVDNSNMTTILEMVNLLEELFNMGKTISRYNADYESVSSKLDAVVKEAASRGIKYVKCGNCGSYMEVNN